MTSPGELEAKALRRTIGLVDYLSDLTDSSARKPLRDITAKAPASPKRCPAP